MDQHVGKRRHEEEEGREANRARRRESSVRQLPACPCSMLLLSRAELCCVPGEGGFGENTGRGWACFGAHHAHKHGMMLAVAPHSLLCVRRQVLQRIRCLSWALHPNKIWRPGVGAWTMLDLSCVLTRPVSSNDTLHIVQTSNLRPCSPGSFNSPVYKTVV